VPKQADSVILGMGERVDATITLNSSAPVVAAAERKDGFAQLNMRVAGAASNVKVDKFVAAVRNGIPLDTATWPPRRKSTCPNGTRTRRSTCAWPGR
jgi:hypothetical protein